MKGNTHRYELRYTDPDTKTTYKNAINIDNRQNQGRYQMSMLYRIKIVADGKFVRYATDEEMAHLRPNADGMGVARLRLSIHKSMQDGEFIACRIGIGHGKEILVYGMYVDVSATHKVEWGLSCAANEENTERIDIYENDIVAFYNKNGIEEERQCAIRIDFDMCVENEDVNQSNYLAISEKLYYDCANVSCKVIGNANENYSLLEEK